MVGANYRLSFFVEKAVNQDFLGVGLEASSDRMRTGIGSMTDFP